MIWLLVLPAYLLGTFPSAGIVARSKGIDITQVGSGNPGASNIARTLGSTWGVVVFVLDGLKGALPAAIGLAALDRRLAWAMAGAAMLGHVFPITRGLRGGKGVATLGGASIVLQPIVSAVLLIVWYLVRTLTHKASLASLSIMLLLPIGAAALGTPAWELLTIIGLDLVVLARHTENIKRLLGGNELAASRDK